MRSPASSFSKPGRRMAHQNLMVYRNFIIYHLKDIYIYIWLVVSTPLKHISQLGLLFPIYGKHVPNQQPYTYIYNYIYIQSSEIPKWVQTGDFAS